MTDKKIDEKDLEKVSGGYINRNLVKTDYKYNDRVFAYCKYCDEEHELVYVGNGPGFSPSGRCCGLCKKFLCEKTKCENYFDEYGCLI